MHRLGDVVETRRERPERHRTPFIRVETNSVGFQTQRRCRRLVRGMSLPSDPSISVHRQPGYTGTPLNVNGRRPTHETLLTRSKTGLDEHHKLGSEGENPSVYVRPETMTTEIHPARQIKGFHLDGGKVNTVSVVSGKQLFYKGKGSLTRDQPVD